MILDLDEEFLHGENVVGDVERPDGHEERRVVQADQLAQHLATNLALNERVRERIGQCRQIRVKIRQIH